MRSPQHFTSDPLRAARGIYHTALVALVVWPCLLCSTYAGYRGVMALGEWLDAKLAIEAMHRQEAFLAAPRGNASRVSMLEAR